MIPGRNIDLDPGLPPDATYWMPTKDEISEEGVGFFRDVWAILDVSREEALQVVADERIAVQALDAAAEDPATFEELATVLERRNPDFPDEGDEDEVAGIQQLAQHGDVERVDLAALEVGVAGLSYALAAVGCVPAASCRSHFDDHSWSEWPVVIAAIDREHAEWLQPLVRTSSCGFCIDSARPDFLAIHARSIREMSDLANMIMDESERNPPPPLRLRLSEYDQAVAQVPAEVDGQQSLFD